VWCQAGQGLGTSAVVGYAGGCDQGVVHELGRQVWCQAGQGLGAMVVAIDGDDRCRRAGQQVLRMLWRKTDFAVSSGAVAFSTPRPGEPRVCL
jgi:hypothetical protein